jgi:hypothetical protein
MYNSSDPEELKALKLNLFKLNAIYSAIDREISRIWLVLRFVPRDSPEWDINKYFEHHLNETVSEINIVKKNSDITNNTNIQ